MKYRELVILLPCHSLEDFPLHHEGAEAEGLLASWSAMWHPALLASAGSLPRWCRADEPPEEVQELLLIVPSISLRELPTGFLSRAQSGGAVVVSNQVDRHQILRAAVQPLALQRDIDPSLVGDFLALGYCYLQVQLLTRHMRYSSNLDEVHFAQLTVAGAEAAVEGDESRAKEKLQSCFDLLAEERDHYYPVDAFLIDLVLLAPTTLGPSLQRELKQPLAASVLAPGELLEQMQAEHPASLELLRAALQSGSACLVGGERTERRLPLLGCESLLAEIRRGLRCYEQHVGNRPVVFGRRRFGLTPLLPQLLKKTGFHGALHATLDDGRFPEGMQIKVHWEGIDGTTIEAIARAPLDASRPETYLNLAINLGQSMDTDHVATICLAHWPSLESPWLDDLRRIARYTSALGRFVTLEQYFRETSDPGHSDRFTADQYRSPYLKQAVIRRQPNPVGAVQRYWHRRQLADNAAALHFLASLLTGEPPPQLEPLLQSIDRQSEGTVDESVDQQVAQLLQQGRQRLAAALPRQPNQQQPGWLVLNPNSFVRRMGVVLEGETNVPAIERPVYAAEQTADGVQAVVDVPPMGFVWLGGPSQRRSTKRDRSAKPLAEDRSQTDGYYLLRNEFFEVLIDPVTGAMRSLYEYSTRGNRLSHQLGFRLGGRSPDADEDPSRHYSVMAADRIDVRSASTVLGEIAVAGRLLDRSGKQLARFVEIYRVWRGTRVLELEIELPEAIDPEADPWNSYYAARFAWADEAAELWRTVNEVRQPVGSKRFEAPQYIEIVGADERQRTTILTGGLPFHRRVGMRMLDSILALRGDTGGRFRLGIGIDLKQPMHAAAALLAPPIVLRDDRGPPAPHPSGWMFHIDARNVIATNWSPLHEEGRVCGFRVRLLEVAGRACRMTLSGFREIRHARRLDFLGQPLGECVVQDGKVRCDMAAGEWIELECRWTSPPAV